MILNYSHIVEYSLPTSTRDHNPGWEIPTFPFPDLTPEESDGAASLLCFNGVFAPSEPLCFTSFLTFWHLRSMPFCHFLRKCAQPGGNSPGICPTVKRVLFPHPPSLNRNVDERNLRPPGRLTPWFKAGFDQKGDKGSRNGAERQETPVPASSRLTVPGRLNLSFLLKMVKNSKKFEDKRARPTAKRVRDTPAVGPGTQHS